MAAMASSRVLPIVGCLACACKMRTARLGRNPEDVVGQVLVAVFQVHVVLGGLGAELSALLLEGVRDVLEEDQPEDDVLALGRIQVAAQLVGGLPQRGLEAVASKPRSPRPFFPRDSLRSSGGCMASAGSFRIWTMVVSFSRGGGVADLCGCALPRCGVTPCQ
jgi:hypothetical protein